MTSTTFINFRDGIRWYKDNEKCYKTTSFQNKAKNQSFNSVEVRKMNRQICRITRWTLTSLLWENVLGRMVKQVHFFISLCVKMVMALLYRFNFKLGNFTFLVRWSSSENIRVTWYVFNGFYGFHGTRARWVMCLVFHNLFHFEVCILIVN